MVLIKGACVEFTSLMPSRSRGCRRRRPIGVGRGVIATGAVSVGKSPVFEEELRIECQET